MQVEISARKEMLKLLKDYLLAAATNPTSGKHEINFVNSSDTILCAVTFDAFDYSIAPPESAKYTFTINGSTSLKGAAIEGDVTGFWINGNIGASDFEIIRGTVGNLSSSSDIRFNSTAWRDGTSITINNLAILLPQGT